MTVIRSKVPFVRVTIVVLVLVIACGVALVAVLTRPHQNAYVPFGKQLIADYGDFEFVTYEHDIVEFVSGLINVKTYERVPVTATYVRAAGLGPTPFYGVREDFVSELVRNKSWEVSDRADGRRTVYRAWYTMLEFEEDKLLFAKLVAPYCPFEFSPSRDGPFVSLPMSRERMVEVFGKPKRWYWRKPITSP